MQARTPILTVLAALSALTGLWALWDVSRTGVGADVFQYWSVARFADAPDLYSADARQRMSWQSVESVPEGNQSWREWYAATRLRDELEVFSTPALYALFLPLKNVSYPLLYDGYVLAMLGAGASGVVLLGRIRRWPWWGCFVAVAVLSRFYRPWYEDVVFCNVSSFQLLAIAAVCWKASKGRWLGAGLLAGILVGIKPNLWALAVVPMMLGKREWLAGLAAGGLTVLYLGAAAFGPLSWVYWLSSLSGLPAFYSWHGEITWGQAAVLLAMCAAVRLRPEQCVSLGAAASLLCSPVVWGHYYVLLLPMLVFLPAGWWLSYAVMYVFPPALPALLVSGALFQRLGDITGHVAKAAKKISRPEGAGPGRPRRPRILPVEMLSAR